MKIRISTQELKLLMRKKAYEPQHMIALGVKHSTIYRLLRDNEPLVQVRVLLALTEALNCYPHELYPRAKEETKTDRIDFAFLALHSGVIAGAVAVVLYLLTK